MHKKDRLGVYNIISIFNLKCFSDYEKYDQIV